MTHLRIRVSFALALVAGAFLLLTLPVAVRAQTIDVTPTVSLLSSGLYHYDYSITNNTVGDLANVEINVISLADAVQNPLAPTGFSINFDPVAGVLDFSEDTETFGLGAAVSGFQFDSRYAPKTAPYTGLAIIDGAVVTIRGTTIGPFSAPEPGTLLYGLTLAPVAGAFWLRRRRAA